MDIEKLRKRFCKDCGYNINIYNDEYFFKRLSQFDGAEKKYDDFIEMILKYGNANDFLDYYSSVQQKAIESIKSTDKYNEFNTMDMNKYRINNSMSGKVIYHGDNVGKTLLSIDMKKANFSALSNFSKEIFNNKDSWEDFLKQFTNEEYIINSKYIRQVIMGGCNSKRQETYEKYLMNNIWNDIKDLFDEDALISFNKDELVLDIKNINDFYKIEDKLNEILSNSGLNFDLELFKLGGIFDEKNKIVGYYKEFTDKSVEFKTIDPFMLQIARKRYSGQKITDDDLVFDSQFGPAKILNCPELYFISEKNKEIER